MSSRDPLRVTLWVAGLILVAIVAALRPYATAVALRATAGPFGTLAAIIAAAALAGRLGAFRILARALVPSRGPAAASAAAVLAFTAALSALINLDVAVVVAMPVALRAARRQNLPAGRLSIAVAITANATSFLLPTSNITSLLLLHRRPLPATAYLGDSWLPWLLVTAVTVGSLTIWAGRRGDPARQHARAVGRHPGHHHRAQPPPHRIGRDADLPADRPRRRGQAQRLAVHRHRAGPRPRSARRRRPRIAPHGDAQVTAYGARVHVPNDQPDTELRQQPS